VDGMTSAGALDTRGVHVRVHRTSRHWTILGGLSIRVLSSIKDGKDSLQFDAILGATGIHRLNLGIKGGMLKLKQSILYKSAFPRCNV
jgi:hypothetical protein